MWPSTARRRAIPLSPTSRCPGIVPMRRRAPGDAAHPRLRLVGTTWWPESILAVLTEIVARDERRVIFQATVLIDGVPRARGHAAQRADPAGVGVAVAERLAVEQALLLGGFDDPADAAPTDTTAASAITSSP